MSTSLIESKDVLNEVGLTLLSADYRYTALTTLALAIIFVLVKKIRSKKWPTSKDFASGLLSLLSIYSATAVGSVFLLTKPPAIDRLGGIELGAVGLISFIILFSLGAYQVWDSFWKK